MIDFLNTDYTAPSEGQQRVILALQSELTVLGKNTGRGIAGSLSIIVQW
jgi:hypothetical protein